MSKPPILMSAQATHSLARLTTATQGEASGKKDTSVAAMLNQLQDVAGMLMQEITVADIAPAKRLAMAKDMAKLIPLLALAERKVHKTWKGKDVEDMTDRELQQARKALKIVKAR